MCLHIGFMDIRHKTGYKFVDIVIIWGFISQSYENIVKITINNC